MSEPIGRRVGDPPQAWAPAPRRNKNWNGCFMTGPKVSHVGRRHAPSSASPSALFPKETTEPASPPERLTRSHSPIIARFHPPISFPRVFVMTVSATEADENAETCRTRDASRVCAGLQERGWRRVSTVPRAPCVFEGVRGGTLSERRKRARQCRNREAGTVATPRGAGPAHRGPAYADRAGNRNR